MHLKLRSADVLRNSSAVWKLHALVLTAKSFAQTATEDKLLTLAEAYRRWPTTRLERRLAPWLTRERAAVWRDKKIGWGRFHQSLASSTLTKSLILKTPRPNGEKGVLFVDFQYNWLRLLQYYDVPKLLNEYLLVVCSTWSPPDFYSIWALAHLGQDPVFLQVANPADLPLFSRFNTNIRPMPIMASDWVNPAFYSPKPHANREIDLLMVAGWSHVKRHWLLFDALRRMRRGLRVVLIGQDADGRTAEDVFREAKAFGVADRIEIIRDASIEQVTDYQCNAKASVIFSAREGACVVVAESMFAGAPVALMQNAHVGARAYINPQTGVLLRRSTTAVQLSRLIEESAAFRPREWALGNISCFQTAKKLNGILRDYCTKEGRPWTTDIVPLCWRPYPAYTTTADEEGMLQEYERLKHIYGITLDLCRTAPLNLCVDHIRDICA